MTKKITVFSTEELLHVFTLLAEGNDEVEDFLRRIDAQDIHLIKKEDGSLAIISGEIIDKQNIQAYIPYQNITALTNEIVKVENYLEDNKTPMVKHIIKFIKNRNINAFVATNEFNEALYIRFLQI